MPASCWGSANTASDALLNSALGSWLQAILFCWRSSIWASSLFVLVMLSLRRYADQAARGAADPGAGPLAERLAHRSGPQRRAEHRSGRALARASSTIRDLEITLVNDRSTDATGEILDRLAAEFPQLNVVHLTELPAGWLGKNHALQLGADRSHGEWLLFTDADIVFEPTALAAGDRLRPGNQVDHLAATPDTRMPSWLLQRSSSRSPFISRSSSASGRSAIRKSTAHVGIGAFNLVRSRRLSGRRRPRSASACGPTTT